MTTSIPHEATERPATQDEDRRIDGLDRIATLAQWVVAMGVGIAVLWLFSDVLLLLFAATLIACQLRGAARFVGHRLHLPVGVALAAIVLIGAGVASSLFYWRGPRLVSELQTVYDQINAQITRFWTHGNHPEWLARAVERAQAYLSDKGGNLAGTAAGLVTSTVGNLGSLLLVAVASIYIAISPDTYRAGVIKLLPKPWRGRAHAVISEESHTLRRWFIGQVVDMLAIGVMTSLGLWLLGVPLFPTLGLIAALCNFVPYIGALAGSLPAIVVALGQSPQTALWVAALFMVVQMIEGNLISPLISRRTVDLPPVLTLFSQTVLGSLFGPFGLVLATPITAAGLVFVRMVYVETIFDDPK